jgi:Tfp pilus assembly protein PilF
MVDNDHTEDGLPYLLAAAKISAQDYQVHKQLGKAYMHLNQLDRSRAELEKAVELAPDSAPTHFMLAQVYRRQGLKEKADAEITRYRALTSGDAAVEK